MKNKRNTYILLSAVLVLWGIIGYRIIKSMNPIKEVENSILKLEKFQPKERSKKETYTMLPNYRDPFLGTFNEPKKKRKYIPKQKKEKIVFPNIEYKGLFSSNLKKNTVYLIAINDNQVMFKLRETHQEVKLLHGDKDKIIVKFKSEKQSFYLKK